jgi:hypothetical protein
MRVLGRVTSMALALLAVGALAFAGEGRVAQGKVTAVSEKAVTLTDDDGVVWNFEVSPGAHVYAVGASRKSEMLASSGRPTTMDEFVREGQYVRVRYREEYGTRYVTRLRVR